MKKILTLGLGLIAFAGLAGCSKKEDKIEYDYDGKGVLVSEIYTSKGGNKDHSFRTDTIYDENNNLLFQYSYNKENKKWVLEKTIENKYNASNLITYNKIAYSDANDLRNSSTAYTYGDNNLLIKKIVTEKDETINTEYLYDSNNNILKEMARGTTTYSDMLYTYDENNYLIKKQYLTSSDAGESFDYGFLYEYTNDSNGRVASYIYKNWDIEKADFVDSIKVEDTYDFKGLLTKYEEKKYDSSTSEYKESVVVEYTYDDSRNETSRIKYTYRADLKVYAEFERYTYKYNENNNMIYEDFASYVNGGWDVTSKTTYTYNKDNKLVKEVHEANGNRKAVTEYKYTYFE